MSHCVKNSNFYVKLSLLEHSSVICLLLDVPNLTYCSNAHSNVYALKQYNVNLFGKFCSKVCFSSFYMSDCDKELYVMKTLSLEKPTLFFSKFSNHFSYLLFHDTWHVNFSAANTHIYINGQWCLKCWYGPKSSCLHSIWLFKSNGLETYLCHGVWFIAKMGSLIAKSQCAHSDMVLLGSPESITSFPMCIWCPQTSVMWFLTAHR